MKIECTPQELKELLKKETPVAGTTDVININAKDIISSLDSAQERIGLVFKSQSKKL